MRYLHLYLLYIWIFACHSENRCHNQCKCNGTGLNRYMECSGKRWTQFPPLSEIPSAVALITLINNSIEDLPVGEAGKEQRPNVLSINISENKIRKVEENVFQHIFPNIRFLGLSKNRIQHIEHTAFFGLKKLKSLQLDRNQISSIWQDAFSKLKNLTFLNLANNQLKVLDFEWFRNLKSLVYLHLEDNRIEKVKSLMYSWPSTLTHVNLYSNRIPMILPIPKHAEMFNLEGNPTFCGCRPHMFTLNDIPNSISCKVKMQCNFIKLKTDCKGEQLTGKVSKFWKDIVAKPICEAPVIKKLSLLRNRKGLPYLTCVATAVPAPNITLVWSENDQKVQVTGVEMVNFTFGTINQLHSGISYCKVSNFLGEVTKKMVVNQNEECNSTCSNWNSTSEIPFLNTRSSKFRILLF